MLEYWYNEYTLFLIVIETVSLQTCTFLNHPEQTPAHVMDQFLLWIPGKETISLTLYSRFKLPWENTTEERFMYNCFTPHIHMLPTLMINLVSLTRTEAALENIMDTLVFPLSDK